MKTKIKKKLLELDSKIRDPNSTMKEVQHAWNKAVVLCIIDELF